MAWEKTEWACGHTGSMQLYGKQSGRNSRVAYEAGKDCMPCWLLRIWEEKGDPRGKRADRFTLAQNIAEGKGMRVRGEEIITRQAAEMDMDDEATFAASYGL
jgi:hypothetical protein